MMFSITRNIGLLTTAAAIQMETIDPQAMHHQGYTMLTHAAVKCLNMDGDMYQDFSALQNMLPVADPNFVWEQFYAFSTCAGLLTSWEALHTGLGMDFQVLKRLPEAMEILFADPRMEFNTDVWNARNEGQARSMLTHLVKLVIFLYELPYTHDQENGSTIPFAVSLQVLEKFAEANEKRCVQRKLEEFRQKADVFTQDVTRIMADSMGVHGEIIDADKLPEKLELVSRIADEKHASFITPRIQRDLILEALPSEPAMLPPSDMDLLTRVFQENANFITARDQNDDAPPATPTAGPLIFPTFDMDLLTNALKENGGVILSLNPSMRKLIPQEYHNQLFPEFDEATVQQARAFLQTIDGGRHCI